MYRLVKWLLYCATVVICSVIIANYLEDYLRCACYVGITICMSAVIHKWIGMYEPMPDIFTKVIQLGEPPNEDEKKD